MLQTISTPHTPVTGLQGPVPCPDTLLRGVEAAGLEDVIEHLDESRLWTPGREVFGGNRPGTVVGKTPNEALSAWWAIFPAGAECHADHRFEWRRAFGNAVTSQNTGHADERLGPPTQLARFQREAP